jgi:hypothetical protein
MIFACDHCGTQAPPCRHGGAPPAWSSFRYVPPHVCAEPGSPGPRIPDGLLASGVDEADGDFLPSGTEMQALLVCSPSCLGYAVAAIVTRWTAERGGVG